MNIPPEEAEGQPLTPSRDNSPQHTWPVISAVIARRDMKALDKMALLSLLHFANVKLGWKAWPSEVRLFEMMGCDQKAGRKALQRLEARGILRKERAKQMHGPNFYWINPFLAAGPLHPKADHDPDADAEHDPKTDAVLHPKADHVLDPDADAYQKIWNRGSEQIINEQSSTTMTMTTIIAPSGAPASPVRVKKGPVIRGDSAREIMSRIPESLLYQLSEVNDVINKRGKGNYRKQLETHIRFRGDRDWTRICWVVFWRWLQVSNGWPIVENPAAFTAIVADDGETVDAPDFSEKTMRREIDEHNKRTEASRRAAG